MFSVFVACDEEALCFVCVDSQNSPKREGPEPWDVLQSAIAHFRSCKVTRQTSRCSLHTNMHRLGCLKWNAKMLPERYIGGHGKVVASFFQSEMYISCCNMCSDSHKSFHTTLFSLETGSEWLSFLTHTLTHPHTQTHSWKLNWKVFAYGTQIKLPANFCIVSLGTFVS